ncbi:fimbria/pilus outer membrane usher protein [Klebsiella sp. BIGb0407]|uniref:fimbria/pilus outer membrane usher protein n=1 Tax=Klebsiella sp. BIGb0407 TaxID=2940603 RepID=UPI00216AA49A|nr:fimbria/pilus outer membrane usher protein [Klebsiella sp. BIGb0407]MCS3430462.1 outer membrane usher protein [Klebsiella sp. BIGb0407]
MILYKTNKKNLAVISSVLSLSIYSGKSFPADYFNSLALDKRTNQSNINAADLSVFSTTNGQMPGKYSVDIQFNRDSVGLKNVSFILQDNKLVPEITKKQLIAWGVKTESSARFNALDEDAIILNINEYIDDAAYNFDFNKLLLNISVPQAAVDNSKKNYNPELWDNSIKSATLNYTYSGSNYRLNNKDNNSHYLNLQSGLHFFNWNIVNYSTYSYMNGDNKWNNINSYGQRSIPALKSQLLIGESSTNNQLFDSFQFRGVQLYSDDEMLPTSMRGFAPVIKGIAKSNAKIIVRQNDNIIYETYVSPGVFEINDLYSTPSSGNLNVTIEESDGSTQDFVVPFSTVPLLQREGNIRYTLTAGQHRKNRQPKFMSGTFIYGLPYNMTLLSGGIYSENYHSGLLGFGMNLGDIGAVSVDATLASARFEERDETSNGQSYKLQYSKNILGSGTSVSIANYRYSTREYYSFDEVSDPYGINNGYNKKSRAQVTLNQNLLDYGSVYLSAYSQNYWNKNGSEKNIIAGYNGYAGKVSYGLNYSYISSPNERSSDHLLAMNFSLPFDAFDSPSRITSSFNTNNKGDSSLMTGLSGSGFDNVLNYNLQQSYEKNNNNTSSISLSHKARYGVINSGYNYSQNASRLYYGVQGGAVIHPEGVTLSQNTGETMGLIKVPDSPNVTINNRTNLKTDSNGYAVVPYLSAFQKNNITLNVSTLGDNTEIEQNSATLIPNRGAVAFHEFKTKIGYRVLFNITNLNNPIPFGAISSLSGDKEMDVTGIVGHNGETYMSGMPEKGKIQIKWGESKDQQCSASYSIKPDDEISVYRNTLTCI